MLGETVLLFGFQVALKWWLLFFVAWCPYYITVMHEPYVFSKCCRYHFLFSNFSLSSFMCLSNLSILSWIASILSSAACTLLNKLSTSDIVNPSYTRSCSYTLHLVTSSNFRKHDPNWCGILSLCHHQL